MIGAPKFAISCSVYLWWVRSSEGKREGMSALWFNLRFAADPPPPHDQAICANCAVAQHRYAPA